MTPTKNLSNSGEDTQTAFPRNQIDNYLNGHHGTFIQQLTEAEAENH